MGNFFSDIGAAIGIGGERKTPVAPAYIPSEASFMSDPAFQQQMAQLETEIATPRQGPSLAEILARNEGEKIARMTASTMASQRGMNPALAAKLASDMGAKSRAEMAGKASAIRAQEEREDMIRRQQDRQTLMAALESERRARMNREALIAGGKQQESQQMFAAEEGARGRLGSFIGNIGTGLTMGAMSGGFGAAKGAKVATAATAANPAEYGNFIGGGGYYPA